MTTTIGNSEGFVIKKLADEIGRLLKENHNLTARLNTTIGNSEGFERAQATIQKSADENARLLKEIDTLTAKIERLSADKIVSNEDKVRLNKEVKDSKAGELAAQLQVERIQESLRAEYSNEVNRVIESLRADHAGLVEQLQEEVNSLRAERTEEVRDLKQQLHDSDQARSALEQNLKASKQACNGYRQALADSAGARSALEEQLVATKEQQLEESARARAEHAEQIKLLTPSAQFVADVKAEFAEKLDEAVRDVSQVVKDETAEVYKAVLDSRIRDSIGRQSKERSLKIPLFKYNSKKQSAGGPAN